MNIDHKWVKELHADFMKEMREIADEINDKDNFVVMMAVNRIKTLQNFSQSMERSKSFWIDTGVYLSTADDLSSTAQTWTKDRSHPIFADHAEKHACSACSDPEEKMRELVHLLEKLHKHA